MGLIRRTDEILAIFMQDSITVITGTTITIYAWLNDRTVQNKGIRFHFTCGESKKKFLSLGKLFKAGSHSKRKALESLETTPKLKKSC